MLPTCAFAESLTDLPLAIDRLSDEDSEVVVEALRTMSRICDESCVPYISDMLYHPQLTVRIEACKTAQKLANPALTPALLDLVRNQPMDEVRLEAIQALSAMGSVYDALLLNITPDNPDEIQRRIIRNIPVDRLESAAPKLAYFARYHSLSTSVATACSKLPEPCISALFKSLDTSNRDEQRNQLRTISLLLESNGSIKITPEQASHLSEYENFDLTSQIQAMRSTPDAILWLATHETLFTEPILLNTFRHLHDNGQFADLILQGELPELSEMIARNSLLKSAYLDNLPITEKARALATDSLDDPDIHISALNHLAKTGSDETIRAQILAQMGKITHDTAIAAMHAASSHIEFASDLAELIIHAPVNDNFGRVYLARWALLILMSNHGTALLNTEQIVQLREQALRIMEEPRRLHAEPAFWFLQMTGNQMKPDSEKTFSESRTDMRRAWIQVLPESDALPFIRLALNDRDESVRAEGLIYLSKHPKTAEQIDDLTSLLIKLIQSDSAMLSTQASATAAALNETACIPILQDRLTSTDTRIAYNALWALQKLHALPNQDWLKSLYYRVPNGILHERLAFLTGNGMLYAEHQPMSEIESRQLLKPGQIFQMTRDNTPFANRDIAIIQDDQSIIIRRTNTFGMVILRWE